MNTRWVSSHVLISQAGIIYAVFNLGQSPKSSYIKRVPNDTHSTNDIQYRFLPLLHHPLPNKILFARSLSNTQTRAVRKRKFIAWRTSAKHCTRVWLPRANHAGADGLCVSFPDCHPQHLASGLGTRLKHKVVSILRAPPTQLCRTPLPLP